MCDKYKPVGGGPLESDYKTEKEQPNIRPVSKIPKIKNENSKVDKIVITPEKKSKWL